MTTTPVNDMIEQADHLNIVRNIDGYTTSQDFELLWYASKKESIVCLCDFGQCRDIAQTISSGPSLVMVSARGICYVHGTSLNSFIRQCEKCNLEWIIPTKAIKLRG